MGRTDPGLGVCSTGSEPGKVLPPPRHQKRGSLGQALRPHSVCPAVEEPLSDVETLHVSIWHVGFWSQKLGWGIISKKSFSTHLLKLGSFWPKCTSSPIRLWEVADGFGIQKIYGHFRSPLSPPPPSVHTCFCRQTDLQTQGNIPSNAILDVIGTYIPFYQWTLERWRQYRRRPQRLVWQSLIMKVALKASRKLSLVYPQVRIIN